MEIRRRYESPSQAMNRLDRKMRELESRFSRLSGYSLSGHTHTESDITDLGSYLPTSGGTLFGTLNSQTVTPRGNNTYDVGDATNTYRRGYFYELRDENGTTRWDLNGPIIVAGDVRLGDQVFFNYATETTSYLQHSTGSNYFRFVQAGSEALRLTHNGTQTLLDIYGTSDSRIRKVEGTGLYIDNEVANQDIYLRTDNGGGIKNRIFIDGSANTITFHDHDGNTIGGWATQRFYVTNAGSAGSPSFQIASGTGLFYTSTSGGRVNVSVASTNRLLITASPTLAPAADNVMGLGAATLRWTAVYAVNGSIQTSDERSKKWIKAIDPKVASTLVDTIDPIRFTMKGRTRRHWGFGAFQVAGALKDAGLEPEEYAVWIDPTVNPSPEDLAEWDARGQDPEDTYKGLRYDELLPVLWTEVRSLRARVASLEAA